MSNVVSFAEFKAARPAATGTIAPNRLSAAPPEPSDRSVAHRQLMLAFLEQLSEALPAGDSRTGTADAAMLR
jgi:hypothetical protein